MQIRKETNKNGEKGAVGHLATVPTRSSIYFILDLTLHYSGRKWRRRRRGKKKNNMAPAAISHVKISILLRFWRKEWNSILNKGFEFSTNRQCESCVGIIKEQMWEAQVKIQQWRFWKGKVCCVTSSHWKKLNCDPHLNGITRTDKFWNKQKITFSTHLEENENKQKPCTLNEKESDT